MSAARTRGRGATAALLLMLCVLPQRTLASVPPVLAPLPAVVLGNPPLPGDETIRARLKACLLVGDLNCVVDQYLLLNDLGRTPGWLVAFQNAFSAANRKAGECERVARTVYEGLLKFGQRPEFIRFSVIGRAKVLGFDETVQGEIVKTHQVSIAGTHIAIRLGNRIIDAYTGLAGLPFGDYMARLSTAPGSKVVEEVVQAP